MYKFTKHAILRLRERSNDSMKNINYLLSNDIYIPIGNEKHKEHNLIYSLIDDNFHIIIKDTKSKEIITILPPDYHNNIAWNIDPEMYNDIKQRTINNKPFTDYINKAAIPMSKFKLAGIYILNDETKSISLGSIPINNKTIDSIKYTKEFWNYVYDTLDEKNINHNHVLSINVRIGKHKKLIDIIKFVHKNDELMKIKMSNINNVQ